MEHIEHEPFLQNSCNLMIFLKFQLDFNSALTLFHLCTWSSMKILPLFLSLSACLFLSFLAESVILNGIPPFLVVAIVVDRPKWFSRDPLKAELFKCFVFLTARKTINIFLFLVSLLCDWLRQSNLCLSTILKLSNEANNRIFLMLFTKTRHVYLFYFKMRYWMSICMQSFGKVTLL